MTLNTIIDVLESIAPPPYAEPWDNVGLLVEPPAHWVPRPIDTALLAIDLTEAVLACALERGAQLIIAYHPPIFAGLKRLTAASPGARVVLRCAAEGVAVYSPHTALDAAPAGLADWLLDGLGPCRERAPISPRAEDPTVGAGRRARLCVPTDLDTLIARIKTHLALEHVRVAAAEPGAPIETVAVCPGAGGSLFAGTEGVDLYLTGEMRHHDVLAKVGLGAAVVLTDHTNTERGYLSLLADRLRAALPDLGVLVSEVDRDPLAVR